MHFSAVYTLRRYLMAFRHYGASNKGVVGKISNISRQMALRLLQIVG